MIVVKIELHSAITGKVSELGRMHISNTGDTSFKQRGDYTVELMRRGTKDKILKTAQVINYPRLTYSVWKLVSLALKQVGF